MKPATTTPEPVGSAEFWKKRIGRALIVGALVLTATQLLPALPQEQTLEVRTDGALLHSVRITYFEAGSDREPMMGTRLSVTPHGTRVTHRPQLPDGVYLVEIEATGTNDGGALEMWKSTERVEFSEGTARVRLKTR